jgi:hypothetical protein
MMKKGKKHKTWREKIENAPPRKIEELPPEGAKRMGGRLLLIAHPLDVDETVRAVPKGKLVTMDQIRRYLAAKFGADVTCPLTTGIFLRIIAEAAEEEIAAGAKKVTPYWRVVRNDGRLNEKFPGGTDHHGEKLRVEGFKIEAATGKKTPRVVNYERKLMTLE